MKRILPLILFALFSCVSISSAQVAKEKLQEIEKLLRLSGTEKLMEQMKGQMIAGLKAQMTQVPTTFWDKFQQRMDMHELLEKIIPVYDKYYTTEDLKAVNAFYESPAGQKMLSAMPQIMQDTMKIGQEWGQKVGRQAGEEAARELKQK